MRRQTVFWAFALFSAVTVAQQDSAFVFLGVNLITLDTDEVFPGQTVLIADGKITAMGPDESVNVLADNPLEDVSAASRPLGVMVRGEWLDRARIDAGLAAIAARRR